MRMNPEETQAIFIDLQEKLMPVMFGAELCEERTELLARGLRVLDVPFLITQQYTKGLGNSVPGLIEAAGTDDYFDKRTFSCVKDEAIFKEIRSRKRKTVLIAGIEAHICVLQTCIDLIEAGFQPVLVVDAIASRKDSDKEIAILRAQQEGVLITTAEAVLFELTVDSRHPRFREISKLVK